MKMSRSVFFSWQSDTPTKVGRNFIDKALETAVARIAADVTVEEAARDGLEVDRDTKGVPGSPPIFQTILEKIDRASIFVGDVTFTAKRPDDRPSPNPNVLIEYGWALKSLGYSQILTVMNDAYGEPTAQSLPFDLAQLRFPISYTLPEDASGPTRQAEREKLAKNLESAIRGILNSNEFKAKFVMAVQPRPFPRKEPKDGKARFRSPGEPIGYIRDTFAQLVGEPTAIPVQLEKGPAIWLRVMPRDDPGRTWLSQEIKDQGFGID